MWRSAKKKEVSRKDGDDDEDVENFDDDDDDDEEEVKHKKTDLVFDTVRIPHTSLPELRHCLVEGGNLISSHDVGDFQKGAQLLAGADLDFSALGIHGLKNGDEIDEELQLLALEALAGLADDQVDANLCMRPAWQVEEVLQDEMRFIKKGHPIRNRCVRFVRAIYRGCCRRRKWSRHRSIRDKCKAFRVVLETCFIRRLFARVSGPDKRYDVFLTSQEGSDKELAMWMLNFCANRSLEVFFEEPCTQARRMKEKGKDKDAEEVDLGGAAEVEDEAETDRSPKGKDGKGKAGRHKGKDGKLSPRSRASSSKSGRGISCLEWLKRRQFAVISSHVLIVCISDDCFENAWVVLDCLWAYTAGIPIIPVKRAGTSDIELHALERQLKWIFALGIGVPDAGPGANRHELFESVHRAITKGLLTASYAKRRKTIPPGTTEALTGCFVRLTHETERGAMDIADSIEPELVASAELVASSAIDGGAPMSARSLASAHSQQVSVRVSHGGSSHASPRVSPRPSVGASGRVAEGSARGTGRGHSPQVSARIGRSPREVSARTGRSPRGSPMSPKADLSARGQLSPTMIDSERIAKVQQQHGGEHQTLAELRKAAEADLARELEQNRIQAEIDARNARLNVAMEERVYGVIAAVALYGAEYRGLSVDASESLRKVSRHEKGCVTIAEFAGTNMILKLAHSANKQRMAKMKESKMPKKSMFAGALNALGGKSARQTTGRTARSQKSMVGGRAAKSARMTTARSQMSMHRKTARSGKGSVGDVDWGHAETMEMQTARTARSVKSTWTKMFKQSTSEGQEHQQFPGAEHGHFEDEEVGIAVNAMSCLRNLACRSQERKYEILTAGGAQVAVKALKVFYDTEEAELARQSASALLRNLSAEVHTSAPILYTAGLLSVAEDELAGATIKSDLQRHLLATVQNMAAHPDAPTKFFTEAATQNWLDVCGTLISNAIESADDEDDMHRHLDVRETKILQQALSALANLALVRTKVISAMEDGRSARAWDVGDDVGDKIQISGRGDEEGSGDDASPRVAATGTMLRSSRVSSSRQASKGSSGAAAKPAPTVAPKASPKSKHKHHKVIKKTITVKKTGEKKTAKDEESKAPKEDKWDDSFEGDAKPVRKKSKELARVPEGAAKEKDESEEEETEVEEEEEEEIEGEEEESDEGDEEEFGEGDEEGGESEELDYDAEEGSSLPTDQIEFEQSLMAADEKVSPQVIDCMLTLLKPEADHNPTTAVATVAALCNFAQDLDVERSIGNLGGLELILNAMTLYRDRQVVLQCLRFLWNMSFSRHNQHRLIAAGGLPLIFEALMTHRTAEDAELQEQGCGVLRNLSTGTARFKFKVYDSGGINVLVKTLADYCTHTGACTQAAAAIRILADGAPPVAEEVAKADGVRALVSAIKATRDDVTLVEAVMHAVELILISPRASKPFCESKGHIEVMNVMERFTSPTTNLRCCRVLAAALVLHKGFDEEELTDSEGDPEDEQLDSEHGSPKGTNRSPRDKESFRSPQQSTRASAKGGSEDGQSPKASGRSARQSRAARIAEKAKEAERKALEEKKAAQGPRYASMTLRLQLLEHSVIEKLCSGLSTYKDNLAVNEAIIGALRNLVMDLPKNNTDLLHALKPETGDRADHVLKAVVRWIQDPQYRRQAGRIVSLSLTLFCSLALSVKSAVVLHRLGTTEKCLEWMKAYPNDAEVQTAGCSFLKNFSASQLRIRQGIVEMKGVGQIADLLDRMMKHPQVLEEALRALHNFAMADGCGIDAAENLLVKKIFKVVDTHRSIPELQAVAYSLLWNISTTNLVNKTIIAQDGIARSLSTIRRFRDTPSVIGSAAGMLRNLIAGDDGEVASHQIQKDGGFKTLREAMFVHRAHPLVVEQCLALFSNVAILTGVHLEFMAREFMNYEDEKKRYDDAKRFRQMLEVHSKIPAIQYQGFSLVGRLVAYKRDLKPCFNVIVPHALTMLITHRNTPVVDMVESVLEEIG